MADLNSCACLNQLLHLATLSSRYVVRHAERVMVECLVLLLHATGDQTNANICTLHGTTKPMQCSLFVTYIHVATQYMYIKYQLCQQCGKIP